MVKDYSGLKITRYENEEDKNNHKFYEIVFYATGLGEDIVGLNIEKKDAEENQLSFLGLEFTKDEAYHIADYIKRICDLNN